MPEQHSTDPNRPCEAVQPALIDLAALAALLSCSDRHVLNLVDREMAPRLVRLGACVRWRRAEIEDWISRGCPDNGAQEAKR